MAPPQVALTRISHHTHTHTEADQMLGRLNGFVTLGEEVLLPRGMMGNLWRNRGTAHGEEDK